MKQMQHFLHWLYRRVLWVWRYGIAITLLVSLLIFFTPRSTVQITIDHAIAYEVSEFQFDYIGWTIGALHAKAMQTLYGQHPFINETDRVQLVRDYMNDLAYLHGIEGQIGQFYNDPNIEDAEVITADLRQERDTLRAELSQKQSTIEAILEGQVATILVERGFGHAGQLLPPMAMRFTRVPNLLVISPRDHIELQKTINLYAMPIDDIERMESRLYQEYDVASLIVPLGGIALYPAMVLETSNIPWVIETFAHEWLHHYLFAFPLGLQYFSADGAMAGETRIINETTADLFGKEISRLVLERYYPDLLPPPPIQSTDTSSPIMTPEPPVFDFGAEMNETRVTLDAFLANGQVNEAEAYMEERRILFFDNGYRIRKLNQAYFAFYGGYQGGGAPGVAGEDPIGPAIRNIRETSEDLHTFIITMRTITTREQLLSIAPQQ